MRLGRTATALRSLAPFLRGEGWGEGLLPHNMAAVGLAETPPHPKFKLRLNFDLSPQAGRGKRSPLLAVPR
ncbi:hypothetical protein XH93_28170 [Bradyrhizobium sp. CCBAU 51753]|nr:hypothetical protein XH93_28170 [Bradyrhizobium sp. CCBAU 51753]